MPHSRLLAPTQSPSAERLTADMVGIGMLVGAKPSRAVNIEDTLVFARVKRLA